MSTNFFGLYRGQVVGNIDPLQRHRLKVWVPMVSGDAERWAEACLPVGRKTHPEIGSEVWIAFEGGSPDSPVWLGVLAK